MLSPPFCPILPQKGATHKEVNHMNDIVLSTQNGEPVASSREIAKRFGKEHKDVLKAINNLTAQNCAVTQMFFKSEYTAGTGKKYPMYLMNRDGFSLLAMGFTGKEAVQWKLKYIAAFNTMEQQLAEQHKCRQTLQDARIRAALQSVSEAQKSLALARENHDNFVELRNATKNLLADVRAQHARNCDNERRSAQIERDWQAKLDARLSHLQIIAFGLPGFDEVMSAALESGTPEKK